MLNDQINSKLRSLANMCCFSAEKPAVLTTWMPLAVMLILKFDRPGSQQALHDLLTHLEARASHHFLVIEDPSKVRRRPWQTPSLRETLLLALLVSAPLKPAARCRSTSTAARSCVRS
jgi:hypothetical protein